jgi:hypothetical protein
MRQIDEERWLRYRPFQPFRIHLTTGITFDVRHPDQAVADRSTVAISVPAASVTGTESFQHDITISLTHIVYLEPIVTTQGGNGTPA